MTSCVRNKLSIVLRKHPTKNTAFVAAFLLNFVFLFLKLIVCSFFELYHFFSIIQVVSHRHLVPLKQILVQ